MGALQTDYIQVARSSYVNKAIITTLTTIHLLCSQTIYKHQDKASQRYLGFLLQYQDKVMGADIAKDIRIKDKGRISI